mgnify:FL=1
MHTQFDALIIGFGKAGKTLAVALAGAGQRVALVEQSPQMYGGTCINIACIPTKTLVSAAAAGRSIDEAFARKTAVVKKLNSKNYHMLADNPGVMVIDGSASFVDAHTVSVQAGEEHIELQADRLFINTGAVPVMPAIAGLEQSAHVYTSTEVLNQQLKPRRLAVIGAGPIGLEFASTYAALGTEVTLYHRRAQLLPHEEPSVAQAVAQALEEQGITLVLASDIQQVRDTDHGVAVISGGDEQVYDAVLMAAGRRPNTSQLGLAAAGVETDERGAIIVNDHLQTTQPHIWALGDVNGGPQYTYVSLDDFRIVKSQLLGDGSYTRAQRAVLPHVIFMQTPLARVGLTEAAAHAQYGDDVKVKELPAMAVPRMHVDNKTTGLLKAVVQPSTGHILGATLFCQQAPEVINTIKTAMDAGLPYTTLRDQIFTHPTVSEALNDLFAI